MSPPTAATVVARRRHERRALIAAAEEFERRLPAELGVLAVVVFGSVARGDHHTDSDVDVLVIAAHLPDDYRDRLRALVWPPPPRVQPVAWTPAEWHHRLSLGDPIATESATTGLWLRGTSPVTDEGSKEDLNSGSSSARPSRSDLGGPQAARRGSAR